jgi:hypothetical protein
MERRPIRTGFEEPAEPYDSGPPASIEVYLELHRQVLAAYDSRCAVTGERFETAWQELPVIAIRPRELGGKLHIGNCLPLCVAAALEFAQGYFTIGVDNELIVDRSRISLALTQRLNADGRLIGPVDSAFRPDADNIRFHRERIFLAFGG